MRAMYKDVCEKSISLLENKISSKKWDQISVLCKIIMICAASSKPAISAQAYTQLAKIGIKYRALKGEIPEYTHYCVTQLMDIVYFLEPADKDLAGAVQALVEKPRVDKAGTHSDIMHLIPFFLMKLNDKAKVEALFKSAKTSVDASIERLIKPIIINIEAETECDEKEVQDLRIVQIATCHYFCKQWPKPMLKVLKLHKRACLQLQTTPDSHYLGYYALMTMSTINMGKLIQTFADYHQFDF